MYYPKRKRKVFFNTKAKQLKRRYEVRHYIADKLIDKGMDVNKFNEIIGIKVRKR